MTYMKVTEFSTGGILNPEAPPQSTEHDVLFLQFYAVVRTARSISTGLHRRARGNGGDIRNTHFVVAAAGREGRGTKNALDRGV